MNRDASPGVPWSNIARDNGTLLRSHESFVLSVVANRLATLCTTDCTNYSAEELVQLGYVDPIRVFVKQEPHSAKKLAEGRYRLIMSVSVIDQIIERLLFTELNQAEIGQWDRLPVKPGMGLSLTEQQESIGACLSSFDRCMSSDISGWDWSVSGDELLMDAHRRIHCAGLHPDDDHPYVRAVLNRVHCLSLSVISFSDGSMVAQALPGVQKSGSYNTSSTNSWVRVAVAWLAGANHVVAMGDDCVDSGCSLEAMAALGHPVKAYDAVDSSHSVWLRDAKLAEKSVDALVYSILEKFDWEQPPSDLNPFADFCSHFICRSGSRKLAVYHGWPKSLYRLATVTDKKVERFASFVDEMRMQCAMPFCVDVLLAAGWFGDSPSSFGSFT